MASRKSLRSSALSMASARAPISSTPYWASTPCCSSASAVLSAVCPPMVGSSTSLSFGRSSRSRGDDLGDDVGRDRLDVGCIRQLRIGHDRRRIGIDQDDPIALGLQRLAGLGAGIIELARLADDDRAGADDQDGVDVCAFWHVGGVLFEPGPFGYRREAADLASPTGELHVSVASATRQPADARCRLRQLAPLTRTGAANIAGQELVAVTWRPWAARSRCRPGTYRPP